jgi:hypothetical protein
MQGLTAAAIARGLGLALCAASATTAGAQQAGFAQGREDAFRPLDRQSYACVDPADATARRRLQREPCRLPMYQLPAAEGLAPLAPPLSAALPESPVRERGHAMFWRLPVQPRGPHEAPRNSWR